MSFFKKRRIMIKIKHLFLMILFIGLTAYPTFLFGKEVGSIFVDSPLKGLLLVAAVLGSLILFYRLGVNLGRLFKSKFN